MAIFRRVRSENQSIKIDNLFIFVFFFIVHQNDTRGSPYTTVNIREKRTSLISIIYQWRTWANKIHVNRNDKNYNNYYHNDMKNKTNNFKNPSTLRSPEI